MKKYNLKKLMSNNPAKLGHITNRLDQLVLFFEHPIKGDQAPIIAVIDNVAFDTTFYEIPESLDDIPRLPV